MKFIKQTSITLLIVFFAKFSFAQEVQETQQDTLGEVILESLYTKKGNLITPVESISAQTIENYSPVDLVQAMNQTPGVYMLSGALNTNRLTIRGIGSRTPFGTNKVRAYFNEIPITNGTGESSLEIYDPEMLQRIDIIKGPKATAYGTNLGGAILLNTSLNISTFFKNSLTIGSFNLIKNSLSGGFSDDKLSLTFNYDHLYTDGYRQNNSYNRNAVFLNLNYKLNSNNEINFLVNKTNFIAHIPSSLNNTAFNENPRQAAQNWFEAQGYEDNDYTLLGLTYTHSFNENIKNSTSVFYSYLDHYEPAPFGIFDDYTHTYGVRSVFSGSFSDTDFSLGTEIFKDKYNWETLENLYRDNNGNGSMEGDLMSDNEEERSNINIFATLAMDIAKNFKVQLGLNLNITRYDFVDHFNEGELNRSAKRNFDPILAPSLNLVYNLNDYSALYANVSRGFSYPSLEETLTPDGAINPDIKPETGMNYELGTNLFFLNNKFHISLAGYIMDIRNLLVADRVGEDQYIGKNAGRTSHKGVEILTEYNLGISSFEISPFINASFNFPEFVDFIDGDNDYSGNKLTGVPDKNINAGVRIEHKSGLFIFGGLQHIGKIPMTDGNTLYTDAYTLLNTKAGYKTNFTEKLSFEVNAGINNLTDEKYASSILINATGFGGAEPRYYYPGDPINYYSGIKLKYTF